MNCVCIVCVCVYLRVYVHKVRVIQWLCCEQCGLRPSLLTVTEAVLDN